MTVPSLALGQRRGLGTATRRDQESRQGPTQEDTWVSPPGPEHREGGRPPPPRSAAADAAGALCPPRPGASPQRQQRRGEGPAESAGSLPPGSRPPPGADGSGYRKTPDPWDPGRNPPPGGPPRPAIPPRGIKTGLARGGPFAAAFSGFPLLWAPAYPHASTHASPSHLLGETSARQSLSPRG